MKSKHYFRLSLSSLIFQLIIIAIFLYGLFSSIYLTIRLARIWDQNKDILIFVFVFIYYFGTFGFLILELDYLVNTIKFDADCVSTRGDLRLPKNKIQHKCSIKYTDISSVHVVAYQNASNGKQSIMIRPAPFLFIKNKNGRVCRFCLAQFTAKSVKSILEELIIRCQIANNPIEIDVAKMVQRFKEARFAVKEEFYDEE